MLDKLNIVQQRFNEISDLIIQPDIISDQKRYIKLNKEYKDLGLLIEKKKIYEFIKETKFYILRGKITEYKFCTNNFFLNKTDDVREKITTIISGLESKKNKIKSQVPFAWGANVCR